MDVKKAGFRTLKTALTIIAVAFYCFFAERFEYLSQIAAFDNIIGIMPFVLLTGVLAFIIALIWKRYRNAKTSTVVIVVLALIWSTMLVPASTGDWYPLAKTPQTSGSAPDLTLYEPFKEGTLAITVQNPSLKLADDLPVLDGATAMYPVYAGIVNSVYDKNAYSPDIAICSNTTNAYNRIINGQCDIIFAASASEKQKQTAKEAGTQLIFTPIGKEAFVFLVGKENPLDNLSYQQIKNIYSGKSAYWNTLGWSNGGKIIAFMRQEGSGSQTGLQTIMQGLPIQKPQPLPDKSLVGNGSLMQQVSVSWNGVQPAIGYSYRYFATTMYPNTNAKMLKIDGVYPSINNISNSSYRFTYNFYAVTNGEPTGNAKKLIDWILSPQGQTLIEQTGYIPLDNK
ncbi:MAG: substrate-binding domain-containing protein [Oscillospiraceae bacterium]|jgi:phosphate transport system substrate-binding protein|nr:substrate-binding domain-containing protein [Oscillospiraceae bacterium]